MNFSDFSLIDSGPVDRLLARSGLVRAESPRYALRAFLPGLLAWTPLLLFALFSRRAGEGVTIGFFHDLGTHVRFPLVVPLLVLAERSIGTHTRAVVSHFLTSGLVGEDDRPRVESAVLSAKKWVGSALVEAILLAASCIFIGLAVRVMATDGVLFWFERAGAGGGERLAPVGWWYVLVSPIVPFLFLRWAWRYAVW